jgi:UPF0042 nucleotide-binding protein
MNIEITSFGYLHAEAPEADITLDLRTHFRDPHVSPELRYLTALDEPVREAVRNTPGIVQLVTAATAMIQAYLAGPGTAKHTWVAVGCAGGRHRAASVALEIQTALAAVGIDATVVHRDLHQAVVER